MKTWKKLIISPEATLKQALKAINDGTAQIAIVADQNYKLLGTVSDGDIRRALLVDISLDSKVTDIMNSKPKSAMFGASKEQLQQIYKEHKVRQIPLTTEQGILKGVEFFDDLLLEPSVLLHNRVLLLVGGKGERLGELTKNFPKPLLDIGGKPLLETSIENFKKQGFHNFLLSVNFKSDIIKNFLGDGSRYQVNINYIDESEALGTAGCLKLIDQELTEPIVIMNGDILTNINFSSILDFHNDMGAIATMCVKEYIQDIPYGVVSTTKNILEGLSEKPKFSYFINAGIYILSPEALKYLPQKVEYFDMTSLFLSIKEHSNKVFTYPINDYWLDIGRLSDLERARYEYSKYFL